MSAPNLFQFATSELSQDAMFAWLLAWSDPRHESANPALHKAGLAFLRCLLRSGGQDDVEAAQSVVVHRQLDRIDVIAEVGADLLIGIEDKVHAGEHGNQLIEYSAAIAKRFPKRRHVLLYVKTGEQANHVGIEKAGWKAVRRKDLLVALRPDRGANQILDEFLDHLEDIEDAVGSFRKTLPAGWAAVRPENRRRLVWAGLYQQLLQDLGGSWDYVANPAGGFMGFWWSFLPVAGGSIYLQLEQDRLVAKVDAGTAGDRRRLRETWVPRVAGHAGAVRFRRPTKLGSGRWMTVGAMDGTWLQTTTTGELDFGATLALLKSATSTLQSIVQASA